MKMKKLLACGLSVAMLISASVANAALVYEENDDYTYIVSELPTKDDIMALKPTLTVTAEPVTDQTTVKDFTSTSFSNNHSVDRFDVYKLNFTFSNLGDLFNGFNADDERAWAAIYSFKAQLKTAAVGADDFAVKSGKMPSGGSTKFTQNGDYLQLLWTASDVENPYPKYADDDVSVLEANASVTFPTIIAVAPNTVINIDEVNAVLTYNVVGTNYQLNNTDGNITVPASVQIGESKPAAELSIEATEVTDPKATVKGNAWKINATAGENAITGFSAKFVSGDKSMDKVAKDFPEVAGGASTEFYVGIKLTNVDSLDSASFTVTDAAEATASDTWSK